MNYSATSHPISWFTERDIDGNLALQPQFQRRRVWTNRQKSNLIESILLKLPVPEIYMQVKTDSEGRSEYVVVDGQQRISAVLEFVGVNGREPFELRFLDPNSRWIGYTFNDLTDEQKQSFYGHQMAVRNLQDAENEEVKDLFRRLNKYLTPLNAQELRNATYRGPFLRMSEVFADDVYWAETGLVTPDAIRRMRDIEFVSDLLIGVLDGPQSGNLRTLDDYYAMYEDYEREFPRQRDCRRRFSRALELIQEVLPDIRSTRWANRTDFYSLFIATAYLLTDHILPGDQYQKVRQKLDSFAIEISKYQENENAQVGQEVSTYVGAMRRGSSDRHRRGVRHQALLNILTPFYHRRSK